MKTSIAVAAFLISMCVTGFTQPTASTQRAPRSTPAPTSRATLQTKGAKQTRVLEAWRDSMRQIPLPKKGSFKASYPSKEWREVPSVKAPPYPQPPRRGPRPLVVGNRNDISAQAPTGHISSATGSFVSVTGVTNESGPIGNSGPSIANCYTLQLNADRFATADCSGSPNPGCLGWQQFVFANDGTSGILYIQYWLIKYDKTCPPAVGWIQFSFTGSTDIYCYKNSMAVAVPNQPIANLGQMSLSGTVSSTGDQVTLASGTDMYTQSGDNAVDAAAGWTTAEFNVLGDGGNNDGGGTATFNSGSAIVPKTEITYGGTAPPNCVAEGFTGEMNNLSFGPAPPASPPGPAVEFTESSTGNATANCADATTIGDTHLTTFKGLLYDFQASGDFVLVEVDSDFVVQTRQVSGAPTWPNASVNSAVATRMGKTVVALCLDGLTIDGKPTDLADGKSLSTSDGVDVTRRGNVYFITSQGGNSVRATVNTTWIDVSVGLGNCSSNVKGLLANANENVNQIAARDGTVLTNPFNFEELYHRFADSWRVSPKESLLPACGNRDIKSGIPRKPFYARDLDPKVFKRAQAVAKEAGVKKGPLLDAATLDVAVIGNDRAARVFVGSHAPIAVGKVVNASRRK